MLFMHKGAEVAYLHASFTGTNPKDNESAYYQVDSSNLLTVMRTLQLVLFKLDINPAIHHKLFSILLRWVVFTIYDQQQKDIYARMSVAGMRERADVGITAEWRYYNNYIDLALALYGDFLSRPKLIEESEVAKKVLSSEKIKFLLSHICDKINKLVELSFLLAEERDSLLQGSYKALHENIRWTVWVSTYASMTPAKQLPFLYDITMGFKKKLKWTEPKMDSGKITKDIMRTNVSTPNEDFYWTSRARWAEVPIWAAPSYTAQLMLLVAHRSGATTEELQAFAYVIFAYWNQHYPHTATPVHRMYGVMTAAKEFGVSDAACQPETMYLQAIFFLNSRVTLVSKL